MRRWIVIVPVLIASALATYLFLSKGAPPSPAAAPPGGKPGGPAKAVSVGATVLRTASFTETLSVPGTLTANEEVDIVCEVGGRITTLSFAEGGRVAKGQTLATLFDADVRARLERARQQLRLDEDRLRRLRMLETSDGVSAQDLDVAAATVAMRKAEVDEIEATASRYTIRAPFAGTVGLRAASVGAVVSPQSRLTTLRDETSLKLDFSVPERFGTMLRAGTLVDVAVRDAASRRSYKASVYAVEGAVDAGTRTLRVRARLAPDRFLLPGMFADINFTLASEANAIAVPSEAVVPDINGATVFVIRNGRALKQPVMLGGRSATHARVLEGLAVGDTVVTTGILQLRNGVPVTVQVTQE